MGSKGEYCQNIFLWVCKKFSVSGPRYLSKTRERRKWHSTAESIKSTVFSYSFPFFFFDLDIRYENYSNLYIYSLVIFLVGLIPLK